MVDQAPAPDLSKYIERRFFGERPHVRGRRIPVATIVYTARDNDHGVAELMYDFSLSESEVLAALLYYAEHKAEIEAQQAEEKAHFDDMHRRQHGED
jgi:uncharacterized protein (DUF433 family)